ncbi:YwpF family protein [Ornithinibacillus scapharcae]|uniref:YwpF family protein n=1 Tax=Ornithinibacillus scapharcae TaxID=1147159 RepID=UPI000225AB21|nr:YwpF family protein [Ornithinibacillus scapharcae]
MKTFLLKSLQIMERIGDDIHKKDFNLLDGLIINREDEKNTWLVEALLDADYINYFKELKEKRDQVMIEVNITKLTNPPVMFRTTIDSINKVGNHISIIFTGTIIDKRNRKMEELLAELIEKGYEGEELLEKFKQIL